MSSSIVKNVAGVLHRVKVKLHPSYLPATEGSFYAKTENEAVLTIDEVCASMKDRGGFMGSYDHLTENVKLFFDEAVFQLLDGFAVNFGYFSAHPNIGGIFKTKNDLYDPQKHPITFTFHVRSALRRLVEHIIIEITGVANGNAFIGDFYDVKSVSLNNTVTLGSQFVLRGNKIKVVGEDPVCGVYFVSVNDPTNEVKVSEGFAENIGNKIIGIVPVLLKDQQWRIVVKTQFTGSSAMLKEPRVITSDFIVEAV